LVTLDPQLKHIERKSGFILSKLAIFTRKISLYYRKNLWKVFIQPLIEASTLLFASEKAKTNRAKLERICRKTFKQFVGLKPRASVELTAKLMNFDLSQRAEHSFKLNKAKWEAFRDRTVLDEKGFNKMQTINSKIKDVTKYLPKELVDYTNRLSKMCHKCPDTVMTSKHLKFEHKLEIPAPGDLLDDIEKRLQENKKLELVEMKEETKKIIDKYLYAVNNFIFS